MKKLIKIFSYFFIIFISQLSFAENNNPIQKKVMFIVHTETQGGKGVYPIYQEMKKLGIDTKIVAIPLYNGWYHFPIDEQFLTKFNKEDVIYPCGMTAPYLKCSSIEPYKPDYIFVQNPYNVYHNSILDPYFTNTELKKIAKK